MAAHWTYQQPESASELEQGDILLPSPRLRQVFSEFHPHFCHEKYLGFLVATQSCDLVLRGEVCKASYINLAVIRPLSKVITKILSHVADHIEPNIFRTGDRGEARRLLERVFNQNEQTIGLFFLYPDADAGIAESSVAFLRVTVALRANHYDVLQEARVGRLLPAFRAKLGWLIGNLYGRPAAPDWADASGGEKEFEKLLKQNMAEVRWIDDEIVERAQQEGINLQTATPEILAALRPPSRLERALTEIETQLKEVDETFDSAKVKKLQNRLRNSGKFVKILRS